MFTLYLVRHGETDWNAKKRYQGVTDLSLNLNGRKQAQLLAERLKDIPFTRCYTSELKRAQETAEAIVGLNKVTRIIKEPALREISFGKWEGLTYGQVARNYPEEVKAWVESNGLIPPVGGESLRDLEKRLLGWFEPLVAEKPAGNILVVAHGGVLRLFLCLLLAVPIVKHWKFNLATGSLAVVEVHGGEGILEFFGEL